MPQPTFTFRIEGRFKPYVRMTQRGKWVKPEAQAYLDSKTRLQMAFKAQMAENGWQMLPLRTPLWVAVYVAPTLHNRDLDNEVKAVLDAAQGVVFPDDRWVDRIAARRGDGDATVVEVGVL